MKMKTVRLLAACAVAAASFAATAAEFKLGYINTERVYREAAPAQQVMKKLEKEFSDRRTELKKMEDRAKQLETLLGKSGLGLDDRKKYERELAGLDRDYRAKGRELAEDFNLRRNEEFAAVQERANRTIKQIAEREQFDLILQDAVYVNPKYDITAKVLKELDK
ncbi:outer membrane protein, OmpH-like [Pseudogulbenkiania sp. NH8B]|uniref:Outer membrane chaperone Skp (OmpH) n=1 Tax=Pseudogulbenkiania ferrooxidans 2002 TaxID=279714 RepID=B9Z2R7_9NEIS|nr:MULTISPECIES: OmpH family outer membrane protein [Pseudogulbenkiania]EEG08870.1 outer membrane chaperone Skp (OmpH) [Pseudogulbenkiania ferrooxidans 2002]BAK77374.1 outer membrane protein, OmpH-like [Pseudogulbenkiania sp. NH8B]